MSVPGHECSFDCRPEEGLHCAAERIWHPQHADPWDMTGWSDGTARYAGYPVERVEIAPDATNDAPTAVYWLGGMWAPKVFKADALVPDAAVIIWFRVPVEVPA